MLCVKSSDSLLVHSSINILPMLVGFQCSHPCDPYPPFGVSYHLSHTFAEEGLRSVNCYTRAPTSRTTFPKCCAGYITRVSHSTSHYTLMRSNMMYTQYHAGAAFSCVHDHHGLFTCGTCSGVSRLLHIMSECHVHARSHAHTLLWFAARQLSYSAGKQSLYVQQYLVTSDM